jgi:hypothetical protein
VYWKLHEDDLPLKKTSKIKDGISQQPLVGYYSNLKLRLRGPNQMFWKLNMKTTMEEDPKMKTMQKVDIIITFKKFCA